MNNIIYELIKILFFFIALFISYNNQKEIIEINELEEMNQIPMIENNINNKNGKSIKDVLFVNGCNPKYLPHPYRYRILHQMEQLSAGFLESDECYFTDLVPLMVCNYRIIIFYRCPLTGPINDGIKLAKSLNKKVLFDIDDLIIDTKYTDILPFLKSLPKKQKELYDSGVVRMGKTLKLCDGAITTTEALAKELKHYVPIVYINRNVASEEMWKLSETAVLKKKQREDQDSIIIGYFSGSISHNPDIEMIKPALIKILKEFKNVKLLLFGDLSFPNEFKEFSSQIMNKSYTDWKNLPEILANVDINIAPIEDNIFNSAKSENKWVEAALVKIPTIASNVGAFHNVIIQNVTGLLCSNNKDWYKSLKALINNKNIRKTIGENAYKTCLKKYNTVYTGRKLSKFINSFTNKHIGFFVPSLKISGGIYVILKHACFLKDKGWDVDLILQDITMNIYEFEGYKFNTINLKNDTLEAQYDVIVATLYSTVISILSYFRTKKRLYLVQGYETDFTSYGSFFRGIAEKTYSIPFGMEYITISKWCQRWLLKKYKQKSKYIPNGIDFFNYTYHQRNLKNKKIRILIEGNCNSKAKNIDESFSVVEKLDRNKFEIWYLSSNGIIKEWYRIDKFFKEIPYEDVKKIYEQCDILLKSSWLESFSYPPLEMMATGGFSVVVPNDGNKEYLKDGVNCLLYKLGDIDGAVKCIERLITDENLQKYLYENGLATARERDWYNFKVQIISLYEN